MGCAAKIRERLWLICGALALALSSLISTSYFGNINSFSPQAADNVYSCPPSCVASLSAEATLS